MIQNSYQFKKKKSLLFNLQFKDNIQKETVERSATKKTIGPLKTEIY